MKYMLLIALEPHDQMGGTDMPAPEISGDYLAFIQSIVESGEYVAGDPLHHSTTATTVRVRNGETTITDGPFAETKEQLGGYFVVDVASLDRALELAAQIPGAKMGSVEVRPVLEMARA
jgi:hypothetical protein